MFIEIELVECNACDELTREINEDGNTHYRCELAEMTCICFGNVEERVCYPKERCPKMSEEELIKACEDEIEGEKDKPDNYKELERKRNISIEVLRIGGKNGRNKHQFKTKDKN